MKKETVKTSQLNVELIGEPTEIQTAPVKLKLAAEIMESRNEEYGTAYQRGGKIMAQYYPNGVTLQGEEDFQRFISFAMCTMKMNRYAYNMENGGHTDSAEDLINYAAILAESTND